MPPRRCRVWPLATESRREHGWRLVLASPRHTQGPIVLSRWSSGAPRWPHSCSVPMRLSAGAATHRHAAAGASPGRAARVLRHAGAVDASLRGAQQRQLHGHDGAGHRDLLQHKALSTRTRAVQVMRGGQGGLPAQQAGCQSRPGCSGCGLCPGSGQAQQPQAEGCGWGARVLAWGEAPRVVSSPLVRKPAQACSSTLVLAKVVPVSGAEQAVAMLR